MAYKFQTLAARMSGSLTQEGDVLVFDHSNNEKASIGIDGHVSGSGALSAGGNLRTAGTVRFDGVADAALDVSADSFYYLDGDSLVKRDTMADYAAAIAGDGLAADSGVLCFFTELTEAAVNVGADSLIFIDADGNVTRRDTFADYATALAGDALAASSGVLAVQTSGSALTIASDKLGISGSIAGDCLTRAQVTVSIQFVHFRLLLTKAQSKQLDVLRYVLKMTVLPVLNLPQLLLVLVLHKMVLATLMSALLPMVVSQLMLTTLT